MNVRVYDKVIEVDVGVDTAAHADGDVVFQPIELTDIALGGGCAVITSVTLIDADDQGTALDLLFFSESVTVGANNAALALSDSSAAKCLGYISIAASDYLDLANNQIATVTNCGLVVKPDPGDGDSDRSIWMAGYTTGTPTYAGGELRLRIGVLRG